MLRGYDDVLDTDQDGASLSIKWGFAHPISEHTLVLIKFCLDLCLGLSSMMRMLSNIWWYMSRMLR